MVQTRACMEQKGTELEARNERVEINERLFSKEWGGCFMVGKE